MRICLAWHNLCSENLGVVALTVSQVCILAEVAQRAQIAIEVNTLGTIGSGESSARDEIFKRTGLRVRHIEFDLRRLVDDAFRAKEGLWNVFSKFDIVIDIGEGDSFSDIYGMRRFLQLFATKQLAHLHGCKVILAPQTIGPFKNTVTRWLAGRILRRADVVYVRDSASEECARMLGVRSKRTTDVAFSLPFATGGRQSNAVGINVSGLLWNGGYTGKNQFGLRSDYRDLVVDIVRGFRERQKEVHLVSHVLCHDGSSEDDYGASEAVKRAFAGDGGVLVAPRMASAIEVKSYISRLAFFAASRMHAAIGAVSAGVPTVPLAYSRKFDSLFSGIGYPYTLDLRELGSAELISRFFGVFDDAYADVERSALAAGTRARELNGLYAADLEHVLRHAKR